MKGRKGPSEHLVCCCLVFGLGGGGGVGVGFVCLFVLNKAL